MSFLAARTGAGPCIVQVAHSDQSRRKPQLARSRVRVDSLYVRHAGPWDERLVRKRLAFSAANRAYVGATGWCRAQEPGNSKRL